MFSVYIFGGTDLTLDVADAVRTLGMGVVGVCHPGREFEISWSPVPVRNVRHADVDGWCRAHGAESIPFESNADLAGRLAGRAADFAIAAGWYHVIPRAVRARFARGCAGVHASLLPKLRGGAPLNWAILLGFETTGVSLFEMNDEIDAGPLYGQVGIPIGPRTDVGDLVEAAAGATRSLVESCLPRIADGSLVPAAQRGTPSYGLQRCPADGAIDWRRPASGIDRLVRAVTRPYPGATTAIDGRTVTVWKAEPAAVDVHGAPGQIWAPAGATAPCVVTGDGALAIGDACLDDGADAVPILRGMNQRRFDDAPAGRDAWCPES